MTRTGVGACIAVALTSGVALAQSAPSGVHEVTRAATPGCSVTFVRAPDDVRHAIEAWLEREPHCVAQIDLRVVPTERGTLYLVAQRPDGRIHEREVPDAAAAGVLVASWVADDWTEGEPVPTPVSPDAGSLGAPANVPAIRVDGPLADAPPPVAHSRPRTRTHWASLAAIVRATAGGGFGAHGDVDLYGNATWSLGVAASLTSTRQDYVNDMIGSWATSVDTRVMARLSYTTDVGGAVLLRASASYGGIYAKTEGHLPADEPGGVQRMGGLGQTAQVAIDITRPIGERWGIYVGAVHIYTDVGATSTDGFQVKRDGSELDVFGGARFRL